MIKTVLAMLLSSLTTSAWWAVATWAGNPGLAITAVLMTAITLLVIIFETLDVIYKP